MLNSDSGAVLTDARPDPVGGIRTGTWEGALDVGPWGDRRQGAFFYAAPLVAGPGLRPSAPSTFHPRLLPRRSAPGALSP
ncbi:hypothetical protein GCM10010378_62630 [Streptomyces viridochromogenes]